MIMPNRTTLDDVAMAAGVSRATASRALSGSGPVSPATKARVCQAAERLDFTPNQAARALASSKTQSLALVIPEPDSFVLDDPFLGRIITGVSEALHSTDYQLILVIVRPDDPPSKVARVLRPDYVDGAIVVSQHRNRDMSTVIKANGLPTVYIGVPWNDDSATFVDVDNVLTGKVATSHLIATGATRVACVAGPADMTPARDRTYGWRQALRHAGLTPGPVSNATFTFDGGKRCMRQIYDRDPRVDAVFAQSDLMAAGAIRFLQDHGIDVPGQVRVMGVDDAEIGRTISPMLSTVTNPATELAMRASRMLLRILDGQSPQEPDIILPELVIRESA